MIETPLLWHLPVNLRTNLEEAVEETASGFDILIQDDQWTVSANNHVLGWVIFSIDSSYFDVELIPAGEPETRSLVRWFQSVVQEMNEEVGSDQCKTGRCSV